MSLVTDSSSSDSSSSSGVCRPLILFLSCCLLDFLCKSSATQVRGGECLPGKDHNGADSAGDHLPGSIVPNGPRRNANHSQHLAAPVSNAPAARASAQPLSGVLLPSPRPAPVREMRRGQTMHAHTRTATSTCSLLAHMYVLAAHACQGFVMLDCVGCLEQDTKSPFEARAYAGIHTHA